MNTPNTEHNSGRGPEDFVRAADQNSRILARLKEAGQRGVTNGELWALGARAAHSRIADLRKRGNQIECKREAAGVWRYTLVSPASEASAFTQRRRREQAEAMPLFTEAHP